MLAVLLLTILPVGPPPKREHVPSVDDHHLGATYVQYLNSPPALDWLRFPDAGECRKSKEMGEAFRKYLDKEQQRWPVNRQEVFNVARDESNRLSEPWRLLLIAQTVNGVNGLPKREWERRLAMYSVRESIGREAYDRGEMPPAIPVWRCRVLK